MIGYLKLDFWLLIIVMCIWMMKCMCLKLKSGMRD